MPYVLDTSVISALMRGEVAAERRLLNQSPSSVFLVQPVLAEIRYGLARLLKLSYDNAAPAAMIGASNHFEVAIATAVMLFGLSSGAALATVVGVLIEVPVMLMLVEFCKRTAHWFPQPTAQAV